jgi:hypothetical protein
VVKELNQEEKGLFLYSPIEEDVWHYEYTQAYQRGYMAISVRRHLAV